MKINYQMELTRYNVTPAQFLAYIRSQAKKHNIPFGMDTKYFIEGEQHNGHYINSHYVAGTPETRPCESETCKSCPMDHQTYFRGFDGSLFNEIVEFDYDTETTGHGYFYTISADGEPDDAERIRTNTINYHTRQIEQNARKIEKNTAEINETKSAIDRGYRDEKTAGYYIKNLQHENDRMTRENAEHRAAINELTETDPTDNHDTETDTDTETATEKKEDETMMSRIEAVNTLTASGIVIHDCNRSETRPNDENAIFWLTTEELIHLVETETETATTTENKEDETMTTANNTTTTTEKQTFPRLLAEINSHYDRLTADTLHYIQLGWFPSWANEHHNDPDRGIKQYSTTHRWEQYKAGEITRERAVELAERRAVNEIEKNRARKIAILESAASTPRISSASVSVNWVKSRTWGANPTAELINVGDWRTVGHASGYGYDKESAAIAEAMNASPAALRVLYELGEAALERGENPRSTSTCTGYHWGECIGYGAGYSVLPYWEGGVGCSCFWDILKKAGYTVRHAGSGKTFDCYTFDAT